jgi:chemotaxis regulatin CheY-phosphate phosphatase CheZ
MTQGKAEALFQQLGKKIDELTEKIKDSKAIKDFDLDARIEELKKTKTELEKEFHSFTAENKETAQKVIHEIDQSIVHLKKAVKEAFGNKKG